MPPDLADQLIDTALAMLEKVPARSLSLRRVAQEAGVSHQAPYVHYGDKRSFLAAVAGVGLDRAGESAAAAVAAAGDDPVARLHALTDVYFAFTREEPNIHDLAFGPLVAKADHPVLQRAAARYWTLLHDAVQGCQPPGVSEVAVLRRSAVTWGAIHGIARLGAQGQIPASVSTPVPDLLHEAIETLRAGWLASPDET